MSGGKGSPILNDVVFTGNKAKYGGGMYCQESSGTLTDVTFSGNQASQDGGAMNCSMGSDPTLSGVEFLGNEADSRGGAMAAFMQGTLYPTLTKVVFSGNRSSQGGAMYTYFMAAEKLPLTNVTFSGNKADHGGAMYNASVGLKASPELTNVILWGNKATQGSEIWNADVAVVVSYSIVQGGITGTGIHNQLGSEPKDLGGIKDEDPAFVEPVDPSTAPTTDGDLHLKAESPAIGTGKDGVDMGGYADPGEEEAT